MPATIKGTLVPQEQRFSERYSPTSGYTREIEWKSFDRARIQSYANRYARKGCEYSLDVVHGVATLHAIDTTGNVTIDTWEIGVSETLVSSILNPRNITNAGAGRVEMIARAIKDGSTIEAAALALEADTGDIYSGDITDNEYAVRLYNRMQAGDDSFFFNQYVLRHTTNAPSRWGSNVADANVGRIYTTAQLLSEAEDASAWIYPLPGRLSYKIQNIPVPAGIPNDRLWGWLKSASAESTAANNRINIVTEYKLGSLSTDEYATV